MQNERTDVHVITPDETERKVRELPMSNEELREWESWARENFPDQNYRVRDRKR
jgi:hypothetical protein